MTDPESLPRNESFSTVVPTLQTAIDATSIAEMRHCWTKYKYSILDGFEPRDTNVHIRFGHLYAHSFETYHHLKAQGLDHPDATHEVVKDLLIQTRIWHSEDPNKNRKTLLRSVIWYLKEFEDDPLKTLILRDGKPAVEQHFDFDIGYKSRLTGEPFRLVGHLDRVVEFEGRPAILDQKTTKNQITPSYFARFNPHPQPSTYLVAGDMILHRPVYNLMIDAAQVQVHETQFKRGLVGRTPGQLDQWLTDLYDLFEEQERRVEKNHFPRNDQACGIPHMDPKTGEVKYGCPFRQVCSADPSMRELLLAANFTRRVWDPSKSRTLERTETSL